MDPSEYKNAYPIINFTSLGYVSAPFRKCASASSSLFAERYISPVGKWLKISKININKHKIPTLSKL